MAVLLDEGYPNPPHPARGENRELHKEEDSHGNMAVHARCVKTYAAATKKQNASGENKGDSPFKKKPKKKPVGKNKAMLWFWEI